MSTTSTTDLHRQAMELADAADLARKNGEVAEFVRLSAKAYTLEWRAFHQCPLDKPVTRSILARSAAVLALQGERYVEARNAVDYGLAIDPAPNLRKELEEVGEAILKRLKEAGRRWHELALDDPDKHECIRCRNQFVRNFNSTDFACLCNTCAHALAEEYLWT